MEPFAEIPKSLDLLFCAQASISLSKNSMRVVRVPLSKTSGPAKDVCWDQEKGRDEGRLALPQIIFLNTMLTSEECEEGDREEYCLRMSAISFALPGGRKRKKREEGFGSLN